MTQKTEEKRLAMNIMNNVLEGDVEITVSKPTDSVLLTAPLPEGYNKSLDLLVDMKTSVVLVERGKVSVTFLWDEYMILVGKRQIKAKNVYHVNQIIQGYKQRMDALKKSLSVE